MFLVVNTTVNVAIATFLFTVIHRDKRGGQETLCTGAQKGLVA